ncbi:MAG TPA: class I SAM-dependent methyltransferase [Stellaceae bacterium]|jgi:O-methyltransferase|nr:class I SAM-dependent methyltransferase [Stellaceae bacterium]
MGARSLLPDDIERYVGETITKETPLQKRLRAETATLPMAMMQIGPDQGALLALLVRLIGARRTLEIGTFTGYSALSVAQALPEGGKVIACDVSEEWTAIARRYWREAGLADRIELRLGPAAQTLKALLEAGGARSFDFAFIDADKSGYDVYYELCLQLIRTNGLIAIDNVLWSGAVVDSKKSDVDTAALRALNLKIRDDARVDSALLTVGDGLMLARKR